MTSTPFMRNSYRKTSTAARWCLLVVKDDRLVWETYLHDVRDRDRYHHVQSVTKSVTSHLAGPFADDHFVE
jgi:hypothetical protein